MAHGKTKPQVVVDNMNDQPPEIILEDNVPIPVRNSRKGKYPWAEMEVGQSFFSPGLTVDTIGKSRVNAQKTHNITLRAFNVEEEYPKGSGQRIKGVRVWRTE